MDLSKIMQTIVTIEHGVHMSADVLKEVNTLIGNFPEANASFTHKEKPTKSVKKAATKGKK
jgi:hypothetical protein